MTSAKKLVDIEKDQTMFGQLSKVQKHANTINKQMMTQLQLIKKLKTDFAGMQRQGKHAANQTKVRLNQQIKQFQERIKNYLITQKAQYMRFSNQINTMIQNGKEINSQLTLLGTKFGQFQKNVGL